MLAKTADLKTIIVDDQLLLRKQMEWMLKAQGITQIDHAENTIEADRKMESGLRYDIMFLDWHMPGKSGYSLLQKYRENREYDNMAIVVISADSQQRYVSEALKAGAMAYLVKPVSESKLKEQIGKILVWIDLRTELPSSN